MLAELEARQAELRSTLLRISGAIQVLGEELAKTDRSEGNESSILVAPKNGDSYDSAKN